MTAVLLTGALGFLGKDVLAELLKQRYPVRDLIRPSIPHQKSRVE